MSKSLAILTARFFDPDGDRIIFGGAERYLIDLVQLLKDLGYEPRVFQRGTTAWVRSYDQVEFHALPAGGSKYDVYPDLNRQFHINTKDFDFRLYFSFDMCYPSADSGSIAISHGIWWDSNRHSYYRTPEWRRTIERCLNTPARIVSVDTNTINWVRSEYPDLADKFVYIPNYVDTGLFKPGRKDSSIFTVLFPRSLVTARGLKEAQFAAGILLPRYQNMEFYFVGRGTEIDEQQMKIWAAKSNRVRYQWFDMKDMPEVYRQSDVVIIPSKYAEGTSLSALEALASGKIVVAGCTGGLTDLIINNFNGFLIPVSVEAIVEKIEEVYLHRGDMHDIEFNARKTSLSFSKERWRRQWQKLLEKMYPL